MKYIEAPFFYNASEEIFKRAKDLRNEMTEAEILLWKRLKAHQLAGLHFRRQHPIKKYIVYFYCHKEMLVIELDGKIHLKEEIAERDEGREYELRKLGLKIIRFTNEEVISDIGSVLNTIRRHIIK
jgi:very-short-patch-repair endonuclease